MAIKGQTGEAAYKVLARELRSALLQQRYTDGASCPPKPN
jgi:hypothetical protein